MKIWYKYVKGISSAQASHIQLLHAVNLPIHYSPCLSSESHDDDDEEEDKKKP